MNEDKEERGRRTSKEDMREEGVDCGWEHQTI